MPTTGLPTVTALERDISSRFRKLGKVVSLPLRVPLVDEPQPSSVPDMFSNDYLSLASNQQLRKIFMARAQQQPFLFGATGSRLLTGNTSDHLAFEGRMRQLFNAPAALLCNSGYEANTAFFFSVPGEHDAILYDEMVHASVLDGIRHSPARRSAYSFKHNDLMSFKNHLASIRERHPDIFSGESTLFVVVESLYSMDGDFCPLSELVRIAEEHVPHRSLHFMVDEAHTTGVYGEKGRGYVSLLGLDSHIHSVLHTFGKGRGFCGAVLLTNPLIRKTIFTFARPFAFTTAMPHAHLVALNASFDFLSTPEADQLRNRLHSLSLYFHKILVQGLEGVANGLLSLPAGRSTVMEDSLLSPIFPILTEEPEKLMYFLRGRGYAAQGIPFPVVPKGQERIRVVIHAGNTEPELQDLVDILRGWALSFEKPSRLSSSPDFAQSFGNTDLKTEAVAPTAKL